MDTSNKRDSVIRFATAVRNADLQALQTAVTPDIVWEIPAELKTALAAAHGELLELRRRHADRHFQPHGGAP